MSLQIDWITQFLGRLHPMLVHFPIGILFIAFFFECISRFKTYKKLRSAVSPALLLGVFSAIASAITGWYLSQEGGYDNELLERHKNLGITTTVFALIVYVLRRSSGKFFQDKSRKSAFYFFLFIPLIVLVSITGHFGGSMTHGEDYLLVSSDESKFAVDPALKLQGIKDVNNATFYADIIQPILESRCYSCHSSRKQKGELRLDGIDHINKGGEHGELFDPGVPDSSILFKRLMLPLEHEDHMPPNEKPQPSSSEIALIQSWIKEGADFDLKISDCSDSARIKNYFASLVAQSRNEALIPEAAVKAPDDNALAELKKRGIIALPVSAGSNYLSISFVNKRTATTNDLTYLSKLKEQIVWLNMARTTISDTAMTLVAKLSALRRVNLEHTPITDKGLQELSTLPHLQYLNLVGTKITDKGLAEISEFKDLRELFIYQTAVSPVAISNLKTTSPDIEVDTGGYTLPKLKSDSIITEFDPS
jgi:uncharacterized membrane protein